MRGAEAYSQRNNRLISGVLSKYTDKKYLKGYVNHIKLTKSELTVYNYLLHIVDFTDYVKIPIQELSYEDYLNYESEFLDKTPAYRLVKHIALKSFSEYLYVTNQTDKDVYKNSPSPKQREFVETVEKRENNYLDTDGIKKYLQHVNCEKGYVRDCRGKEAWQSRDKAIIAILLNTGMRVSAVYKLDVFDIDFTTKRFSIKEKGKIRTYVLNEFTLDAIREWLVHRGQILGDEKEDALFISNQLTRLCTQSISNITVKYGIGVKDIHMTPHKLRATFGTNFYAMTNDIYATKEAMGHSNISTTEIYIRGQGDKSRQLAAEKMQELCVDLVGVD